MFSVLPTASLLLFKKHMYQQSVSCKNVLDTLKSLRRTDIRKCHNE